MKHEEKAKPCADCGTKTVVHRAREIGETAAGTYDVLVNWGCSEDVASRLVELGIRATPGSDKISVLTMALSASAERAVACDEAIRAYEVEMEELEKEYEDLERSYNVIAEAFEGSHSKIPIDEEQGDDYHEGGPE